MLPMPDTLQLNADQKVLVTRAMLEVARVDAGHTAEEIALIRAFHEADDEPGQIPFDTLLNAPADAPRIGPDSFPDADQRQLVLLSCLMVAYADGRYSQAEAGLIAGWAAAMGVAKEDLQALDALVQDHLLSQLAGLPDVLSVARVGEELAQSGA